MMNFTHTYESWGEQKVVELKPNGAEIWVNQENKQEFVELYIDFIFNKQIEKFFRYFYQGFNSVCKGQFLYTFEPEELELLICGSPILDFEALRKVTKYEDGYDSNSRVITWFWEIVLEFDED